MNRTSRKEILLPDKHFRILLIVFLVALVPRAVVSIASPHQPWQHWDVTHDVVIARNLAQGHGFANEPDHPTAYRYPVLPFVLSLFFRVLGERYVPFMLFQAFLGALVASLTAYMGIMAGGKRLGLAAGLLTAVNPELISFTRMMLTETIFSFLLCVAAVLLIRLIRHRSIITAAFAGVVLGLASLCRPVAVVWGGMFGLFYLAANREKLKSSAVALLIMASACFLVLAPWLHRNYRVMGSPVLATSGGVTLWIYGHNDAGPADENTVIPEEYTRVNEEVAPRNFFSTGEGDPADIVPVFNMEPRYHAFAYEQMIIDRFSGLDELDADREFSAMALEYMLKHPLDTIGFAIKNLMRSFVFTEMNGRINLLLTFMLPFMLLGAVVLRKSEDVALSVLTCIGSMLAIHLIFYFDHRFRVPYQPFLMLIGAAGLLRFWEGGLSVRERSLLLAGLALPVVANYFELWGPASG